MKRTSPRVTMRSEITDIHRKVGSTTIYVTHDQTEAMTMADKIVVMKDGYIQQVGNPYELYFKPVNLFVAGFIGMPPMNFINAVINVEGSDVFVSFENVTIKLPERYAVEEVMDRDGQEVIFGVRPEAITDDIKYSYFNMAAWNAVAMTSLLALAVLMLNKKKFYQK